MKPSTSFTDLLSRDIIFACSNLEQLQPCYKRHTERHFLLTYFGYNKSAKLTQNTSVVFVVNSMIMAFLGAGYLTWRSDTANSVFGQFKCHNLGVPWRIWQVIKLGRDIMPTNIFTKFDKNRMKTL